MSAENFLSRKWHVLLLLFWLCLLLLLICIGTGVEWIVWVNVWNAGNGNNGRWQVNYGLFRQWNNQNSNEVWVTDWNVGQGGQCDAYKSHFQAASAFAIISIFILFVSIIWVICENLLEIFRIFELLGMCIAVVAWLSMMFTWAIMASVFTNPHCTYNGAQAWSTINGMHYSHGFYLFLIPWIMTFFVFVMFVVAVMIIKPGRGGGGGGRGGGGGYRSDPYASGGSQSRSTVYTTTTTTTTTSKKGAPPKSKGGAIPAGYNYDKDSGMYWSNKDHMYYDTSSRHFYHPEHEQWYNPDTKTWYRA